MTSHGVYYIKFIESLGSVMSRVCVQLFGFLLQAAFIQETFTVSAFYFDYLSSSALF